MVKSQVKFQGQANIYLQGRNALEPTDILPNHMTYYVGSPTSRILVRDHRKKPIQAALRALNGIDEEEFADVFNQPSWIEIRAIKDQAEIEIFESKPNGNAPTLWLGVIYDGKMAVHDIDWEILKPVGVSQIAFAALVR